MLRCHSPYASRARAIMGRSNARLHIITVFPGKSTTQCLKHSAEKRAFPLFPGEILGRITPSPITPAFNLRLHV